MNMVKQRTTRTVCRLTLILIALLVMYTGNLDAQEGKTDSSRFSHTGLKASIAFGIASASSDLNLKTGNVLSFSLGYGFSNNLTFWLSYGRAKHQNKQTTDSDAVFNNPVRGNQYKADLQYKFRSQSRLQPYGKVGWGVYSMSEENVDVTKIGTGFAFAVGADYFFSRHFGFGVEVNYKILNYTEESRKVGDDEWKDFDLDPILNGNSLSIVITFTIQ
jgi:outer membrane protein W